MKEKLRIDEETHGEGRQKLTDENRDERKRRLEQLFAERDQARKNEPIGRLNRDEIYREASTFPERNDAG